MEFRNCYEDIRRAESYAKLEFPGTYHLAFRDLPAILEKYAKGKKALDFGCGTGRSTRFLKKHGFRTTGLDIAADMLRLTRDFDPRGDYKLAKEGDLGRLAAGGYDVILSAFTFDNIPTLERKVSIFKGLARLLKREGVIINLVSSPEMYTHEWASFSTRDFPENKRAKCGDTVLIIQLDVADKRPVEDILWPDADYKKVYGLAGLHLQETFRPLGKGDEPYSWENETRIPPWAIYVLKKAG